MLRKLNPMLRRKLTNEYLTAYAFNDCFLKRIHDLYQEENKSVLRKTTKECYHQRSESNFTV